jgi:sugar phosphate isomerase/epimerase
MKLDGVRRYLLPGEGSLDLQGFLTGLAHRGYGGSITVEGSGFTADGELDLARAQQIAAVVNHLSA